MSYPSEHIRPGLYPRQINMLAWNLMLNELSHATADQIVGSLFQPGWTRMDVQIFIKQLAGCHLSNWYRTHLFSGVCYTFDAFQGRNILSSLS